MAWKIINKYDKKSEILNAFPFFRKKWDLSDSEKKNLMKILMKNL